MRSIYLDYAATTPVDSLVKKAMIPYFGRPPSAKFGGGGFGNPSSLHFFGQEARTAVDESRGKITKTIGADFREIIFTGSATEANNLALRGALKGFRFKVLGFSNKNKNQKYILTPNTQNLTPRVIVSAIEHESILETARDLESEGVEIIYLPVNREGIVDFKKLKEVLNERTILISIIYANNEIGTIQPMAKIAEIIKEFRIKNLEFRANNNPQSSILNSQFYPLLHTDAVQAFQYLDCDVNKLGVDLMTLSAHKIYGPKGIGALYIKNSKFEARNSKPRRKTFGFLRGRQIQNLDIACPVVNERSELYYGVSDFGLDPSGICQGQKQISDLPAVLPLVTGGGQEFGFRSGTENVAAIVGFAKAVELVSNSRELENKRVGQLTGYFWKQIKKIYPKAELNGISKITNYQLPITNLPNILNIYFPGKLAEDFLIKLDLAGIAVSSGSACSTRSSKPSHVLKSCGLAENRIKSSVRFSLGRFTTKAEINETIKRIKSIL